MTLEVLGPTFRRKPCPRCASLEAEVERLREQLAAANEDIERLIQAGHGAAEAAGALSYNGCIIIRKGKCACSACRALKEWKDACNAHAARVGEVKGDEAVGV